MSVEWFQNSMFSRFFTFSPTWSVRKERADAQKQKNPKTVVDNSLDYSPTKFETSITKTHKMRGVMNIEMLTFLLWVYFPSKKILVVMF
jgi:hypothetical protein